MRIVIALSALALAACSSEDAASNEAVTVAEEDVLPVLEEPENVTDLSVVDEGPTEAGTLLPPANRSLRFAGQWAAEASFCEDKAWTFAADRLTTPAGSVCRFKDVREVPGGYDIDASCTAEGPEQDDVLEIRFAESARAMMFESESIADAGLVWCGEED